MSINTNRFLVLLKENKDEQSIHCLNGTYAKIAKVIGFEATLKLHAEFGGGYVSLPKKLLSDEYVYQCILNEYNGANARELAKSLDCTYSWILKIVKRNPSNAISNQLNNKNTDTEDTPDQLSDDGIFLRKGYVG